MSIPAPAPSSPAPPATPAAPPALPRRLPAEIGVALVCAGIFLYFSSRSPAFHSPENLRLLAKQSTQLALIATA